MQIYSSKISTSGVDPGPRVGGFLVECGGFLYLYGGTSNEFTLQHVRGMYKLDTSSFTWYEVCFLLECSTYLVIYPNLQC